MLTEGNNNKFRTVINWKIKTKFLLTWDDVNVKKDNGLKNVLLRNSVINWGFDCFPKYLDIFSTTY